MNMKKAFILFVLSVVFFGCSNDDNMHSMRVSGKLLNQITQTPIPNGKIYYRAFYVIGTGDWATEREISKDSTFTDSAGSFTAN